MSSKLLFGARAEYAPLTIIRTLGKHKIGLLVIWLVLTAACVAIVLRLPAVYKAEALVLVDSQKIPERYVNSSVATDLQDRLATINQQILSTDNLQKLIETFDLYRAEKKNYAQEDILEMMHSNIKITLEKGWASNRPGAFRVEFQGESPTTVAAVANKIAQLYVDENLRTRANQAAGTSQFLKSQVDEAKRKLDELEAAVSKYKREHNGELPQQENSLNAMLARLQAEYQSNQEAVNHAQQNKIMVENMLTLAESALSALAKSANELASVPAAAHNALAAKPQKASEALEDELNRMRVRYSDDFPDVKRLRAEIAQLKAAEAQDAAKTASTASRVSGADTHNTTDAAWVRPGTALTAEAAKEMARERERIGSLNAQLKQLNHELETRSEGQKRILAAIDVYQRRLEILPVREQQMEGLTRDYEISQLDYKSKLEKKNNAEMAAEMELSQRAERFTVLNQARIPEKPFSPNRPLLFVCGCMLSLLLGTVFAVGRELKTNSILGEWELPANVAAIGRVPHIKFVTAGKSEMPRRWRQALVSSLVISLLAVVAVGLYYAWSRM